MNGATGELRPLVLKFGGTSVRDADAMRRVVGIVTGEAEAETRHGSSTRRTRSAEGATSDSAPSSISSLPSAAVIPGGRLHPSLVVTSACSGVTDQLLEIARLSGEGALDESLSICAELRRRHLEILHDLSPSEDLSPESQLCEMLDEIERLVGGVILLGELTPRTIDQFVSYGERLSSLLLVTAFRIAGSQAALADSRRMIITDDNYTVACPLIEEIDRAAPREILPLLEEHDVVVAQGFIGATVDGVTTTIGRGGSDHTGALLGAALGASEIQIWTDVSGILTADPRIVAGARVVPEVTFTEARELAYFGAKVIHPDTILPAVERAIPVVIKNSLRPADPGTRILPDGSPTAPGIHSITIKKGMTLLSLSPRDPRGGAEALGRAFSLFAEHQIPLFCSQLAESRAIATVASPAFNDFLLAALESICNVVTHDGMAILCMTGSDLLGSPETLSEPLSAMGSLAVNFVAAGSSEHLLLIGIDESYALDALRLIHARLFE